MGAKRKVYCLSSTIDNGTQLHWAYKDDSIKDFIPDIIYKVNNYNMTIEVATGVEFERWATSFDL